MGFRRHGVRLLSSGGLRVTLSNREHDVLRSLPAHLEPLVSGEARDEAAATIAARLYPAAYDDPRLESEYRELAGDELVEGRVDALEVFAGSLDAGKSTGGTWSADLEPDQAQAWLTVVNDARLVFAAMVGVTSESQWEDGPDPSDPASMLLWYLGWLEEQLVGAMMGSLPDD